MRDAGFSGQITTQVLSADDAVMEQPAGAMVDSEPVLQDHLPETGNITLYVNPAPMPEMTSAELELAEELHEANPTTISATNAKTIARRCSRTMIAAERPTSDCATLPLLVQGNDLRVSARNELVAQSRNPLWAVLNHRTDVPRAAWYRGRETPSPGCGLPAPNRGDWCDEFPFWSTSQAYGGALNGGVVPGIRWAPNYEQRRQGAVVSKFYGSRPPSPRLPFSGCTVPAQSAAATLPQPASSFATVGVPYGMLSTSVCNRP